MLRLGTMIVMLLPTMAMANSPFDGAPASMLERSVTFHGQPVPVVVVGAFYHKMNLKKGQKQPVGLEENFFIVKSPDDTDNVCEKVFKKVVADEAQSNGSIGTFPYIEILVREGAHPAVADNGQPFFLLGDVTCWEAYDLGEIFY